MPTNEQSPMKTMIRLAISCPKIRYIAYEMVIFNINSGKNNKYANQGQGRFPQNKLPNGNIHYAVVS